MTREEMEKLVEAINKNFGPPFLPENLVKATLLDGNRFMLQISRRDVIFDANMQLESAGTTITPMENLRRLKIASDKAFAGDGPDDEGDK